MHFHISISQENSVDDDYLAEAVPTNLNLSFDSDTWCHALDMFVQTLNLAGYSISKDRVLIKSFYDAESYKAISTTDNY